VVVRRTHARMGAQAGLHSRRRPAAGALAKSPAHHLVEGAGPYQ
jgi:hypothetical protein